EPPLCVGASGTIWSGGNSFITSLKGTSVQSNILDVAKVSRPPWVFGIAESKSGVLWLATYAGLVRYEPKTASLELAPMHTEFERMPARAILRDSEERYWVLFCQKGHEV